MCSAPGWVAVARDPRDDAADMAGGIDTRRILPGEDRRRSRVAAERQVRGERLGVDDPTPQNVGTAPRRAQSGETSGTSAKANATGW